MIEFLKDNSMYVVFIITFVIWFGIAIYILLIDKKISKLEKEVEFINANKDKQ